MMTSTVHEDDKGLDDVISTVMNNMQNSDESNETGFRPTSTPTKEDPVIDEEKDFREFISMIRDDETPNRDETKKDNAQPLDDMTQKKQADSAVI